MGRKKGGSLEDELRELGLGSEDNCGLVEADEAEGCRDKVDAAEGAEEDDEEEDEEDARGKKGEGTAGSRRRRKGKKRHHDKTPGKLGFDGIDDDGSGQSIYKGMSSGARAALRKKRLQRGQKPELPPETVVELPAHSSSFVDVCAHLHLVAEKAGVRTLAELSACATPAMPATLESAICAYCDPESLDPAWGSPRYRVWDRLHGAGPCAEDDGSGHPTAFGVSLAFGLHPTSAGHLSSELLERISRYLSREDATDDSNGGGASGAPVAAVGLVGLDYSACGDGDERTVQKRALAELLTLARQKRLPVLLTCVGGDAAEDDLLATFGSTLPSSHPAVLLNPSPRLMLASARALPGALFAFTGAITHTKAKSLHEAVFDCPMDRLTLASGSPGFLPSALGGGRRDWSHPGVLPMVAEKVAELKMGRVSTDEVLAAARDNARRVLFAPAAAPR